MAPAAVPTDASCTVWMESTISSFTRLIAGARHHGFEIGIRDHSQVRRRARRGAGARTPICAADSSADRYSVGVTRADVIRELQQQRRFADAGLARLAR